MASSIGLAPSAPTLIGRGSTITASANQQHQQNTYITEATNGAITTSAVNPDCFVVTLDQDFICQVCYQVPRHAANPGCCGQISCRECLLTSIDSTRHKCPFCRQPCTPAEILPSPYSQTKLAAQLCWCPFWKKKRDATSVTGISGGESVALYTCQGKVLFGRDGVDLVKHVSECDLAPQICVDCKATMSRAEYNTKHRPDGHCTVVPKRCHICEMNVVASEWREHQRSEAHLAKVSAKSSDVLIQIPEMATSLADLAKRQQEFTSALDAEKIFLRTCKRQQDEKILQLEARMEQKLTELRAQLLAEFCEFDVPRWSQVKEAALFSTGNPLKSWGHEWWLKVEKVADRIGLYLCCGEDGRFPVNVDYQLMVRQRNTDNAVCASAIFRTEFGKEKAWGLSKFTNLEQLAREGAYDSREDRVTFGCLIYPIRGLIWGRSALRPP